MALMDKKVGRFHLVLHEGAPIRANVTADKAGIDGQHNQVLRNLYIDDLKDLHYATGRAIEAAETEERKWRR